MREGVWPSTVFDPYNIVVVDILSSIMIDIYVGKNRYKPRLEVRLICYIVAWCMVLLRLKRFKLKETDKFEFNQLGHTHFFVTA